jgi:hypothetical protein
VYSAKFSDCKFHNALIAATFNNTSFDDSDFSNAILLESHFIDIDLGKIKHLDKVRFAGHCTVDHRSIIKSGILPKSFYIGCGFPPRFAALIPEIAKPKEHRMTCFISYSSKDEAFVKKLYNDLQREGISCFYAPEDLKIGDRIRQTLNDAVGSSNKLLLILSKNSIDSGWVEFEVETALEREQKEKVTLLFPVMIDHKVMSTKRSWAASLRRQRHIGDFSKWADDSFYTPALRRLLRDMEA